LSHLATDPQQIWHQMNPQNISENPENMSSEIKASDQPVNIQELSNV
jgi:hypothetical protein